MFCVCILRVRAELKWDELQWKIEMNTRGSLLTVAHIRQIHLKLHDVEKILDDSIQFETV